ncbi:beta-ketoacyl-[acyl-carrier-protein] synthase family protein [Streptomyces sp. NPDC007205]|uniref:beta-ketoacyl-[acyl-carrier-protein] synthase family protein n=1 Tax=Streptomyces sp. NPDC007205 TaxID=3154316 RepID=UPI0033F13E52
MIRRVVITGVGAVSGAGGSSKDHLSALLAGRSLARRLTDPWFDEFVRPIGVPVSTTVPAVDGLPRYVALADLAIAEAVSESGLTGPERADTRLITATATGAIVELESAFRGGRILPPGQFSFDHVTEWAHMRHGVGGNGGVMTVSTGCTAGLDALGSGYDTVASGRASRVLVVAAEAPFCPFVLGAFTNIGALSNRDVDPEHASCPFSQDRDGFVLGEGAAAVVLEELPAAIARGAAPLIEVFGWASVSSAYHMTRIRTSGVDIAASIREALDDAGLPPTAVEALDAHGTSTPLNDAAECAAYRDVFGDRSSQLPVVAQKGVTGHSLGAAGLLEVAGISRYLPVGMLPPTGNTTPRTLDAQLDLVLGEPRHAEPEIIVKTSSGFSGIHTAVVFGRVP